MSKFKSSCTLDLSARGMRVLHNLKTSGVLRVNLCSNSIADPAELAFLPDGLLELDFRKNPCADFPCVTDQAARAFPRLQQLNSIALTPTLRGYLDRAAQIDLVDVFFTILEAKHGRL
jgi:hypothetical protein